MGAVAAPSKRAEDRIEGRDRIRERPCSACVDRGDERGAAQLVELVGAAGLGDRAAGQDNFSEGGVGHFGEPRGGQAGRVEISCCAALRSSRTAPRKYRYQRRIPRFRAVKAGEPGEAGIWGVVFLERRL